MDTIKDLFENEELMNSLVEDLEEPVEDSEVFYSVWAIGYDRDDNFTDDNYLLGEFVSLEEATAFADRFNLREFLKEHSPKSDTTYLSIEVDTTVGYADEEDCSTMTVETVYHNEFSLAEEELGLDGDLIIAITEGSYEILEDNTIKIRKEVLVGFNNNDEVNIYFLDDKDSDILRCKLVSEKDNYYFCELVL